MGKKPNTKEKKRPNYKNDRKPRHREDGKNYGSDGIDVACDRKSGRINDPMYYFLDDQLKNQITNISFNQFNGTPNSLGTINYQGNTVEAVDKAPYAMRIELSPSAGYTGPGYSSVGNAVNLAALKLYTELSANNAKTTNYAPQDLTTMILAIGSVISLSSHITRAFGMLNVFNQRNRAYPRQMLEIAGFDYDDLIGNAANYRIKFNTLMTAANKIPIPANIPYFKKCSDLYHGSYWDMDGSNLAQTYLFVPGTEWLFNEAYSEAGTGLETVSVLKDQGTRTMDIYLTLLDEMIGALLNSITLNSIYSDVIRVATKSSMELFAFTGVADDYVVLPTYEPEVRHWINNATICGYPIVEAVDNHTAFNDVQPSVEYNRIIYQPAFRFNAAGMDANFFINFEEENPSADVIVESTRLVARFKLDYETATSTYVSREAALPDHYVNLIRIYGDEGNILMDRTVGYTVNQAAALSAFDWSPAFYNVSNTGVTYTLLDLQYYTDLDFDYVKALQDSTYLGLLTIR